MKESLYFPHDYNASGDEKISKMVRKHGWQSYGLYWALVERLYQNGGRIVKDYEHLAYDLRVELGLVKSICGEFDLFYTHMDTYLASRSVDRRLAAIRERSKKAREAGRLGAIAKHSSGERQATAKQTPSKETKQQKVDRGLTEQQQPLKAFIASEAEKLDMSRA